MREAVRQQRGAEEAVQVGQEAILDAFRRGDERAVAEVRSWVVSVVSRGNWRFRDPEGVVQEVLLKLVRLADGDRFSGRSSFKTFVFSVAKFTCVDVYRVEGRRPQERLGAEGNEDPPAAREGGGVAEVAERRDLVRYVLQHLPEECVRLWRLLYGEDLSASEVAKRLGTSAGAIRVRVHRCLKRARRIGQTLEAEGWQIP